MGFINSFGSFCPTCSNSLQTASKVDLRGENYIYNIHMCVYRYFMIFIFIYIYKQDNQCANWLVKGSHNKYHSFETYINQRPSDPQRRTRRTGEEASAGSAQLCAGGPWQGDVRRNWGMYLVRLSVVIRLFLSLFFSIYIYIQYSIFTCAAKYMYCGLLWFYCEHTSFVQFHMFATGCMPVYRYI